MRNIETILSVVGTAVLVGGFLIAVIRYRSESTNISAQASEHAVKTMYQAMERMEEELESLQDQNEKLHLTISDMKIEVKRFRMAMAESSRELAEALLERDAWKHRAIDLGWNEHTAS